MPSDCRIVVLGEDGQAGSYILRIRVDADLLLAFGGFRQGRPIPVPAGEYLYVGSALAATGGVSLARRLVRHATRTGVLPPHAIREEMLVRFDEIGLGSGSLLPRNGKHRFWNVDHLLDQEAAEIRGVWVLRWPVRLERELGRFFEEDPCTEVFARGLGANDVPGNTHLLGVHAAEEWWQSLAERLRSAIFISRSHQTNQMYRRVEPHELQPWEEARHRLPF
jgi:Uri superfamily endonuclease